jgi:hypothetical protein
MNNSTLTNKVPKSLCRSVVDCIVTALQDDRQRYLSEFQPDTTNGLPHQIGDWINTNVKNRLAGGNLRVVGFSRSGWRGKIIIDDDNKIAYTIMRTKRIAQIQMEKRNRPHYLQSLVCVLNAELKADIKQLSIDSIEVNFFEQDELMQDCSNIFGGSINEFDHFTHCVIGFETKHNELTDIAVLVLDKDLDIVEEMSLNEYIKPDFAGLTNNNPTDSGESDTPLEVNNNLLTFKPKSQNIIRLKGSENKSNK